MVDFMNEPAHILVVDDDPGIRFLLEEILSNQGYHVTIFAEGQQALDAIKQQEFDLAFLDLHLDDQPVDGLDVLAKLRETTPDTVAIMLTAYASLETAVAALRQGAHDYLFKPNHPIQLRESVRRGLKKRQELVHQRKLLALIAFQEENDDFTESSTMESKNSNEDRFLELEGLIIDLVRYLVTLNGHLLELSPTEFNLLTHLTREFPNVISPQDLVLVIHGYQSQPEDAAEVIRYHIYRIRNKLKAVPNHQIQIRTVRSVGYSIAITESIPPS